MTLEWEGRQPAFFILGIVFPVIATAAALLRFHATKCQIGNGNSTWTTGFYWVVWLIVYTQLFNYALTVNLVIGSQLGGLGGHMDFTPDGLPIPSASTTIFLQTNYSLSVIVIPCLGLTKISTILLYRRIFASHVFRKWTWFLLGAVALWMFVFLFTNLFQCWPLYAQWTPGAGGGCMNLFGMFMASLSTNTVTDILVLAWPLREVWRLHMPLQRRLAVMGIFMLGGFVTVIGLIRIYYLAKAQEPLLNPLFNDITYNFSPAMIWTIVEVNVGTVCACLPLMRPLYEKYSLDRVYGSVRSLLLTTTLRHGQGSSGASKHSGSGRSNSCESAEPSLTHLKSPPSDYSYELSAKQSQA